ncbi:hypothetical protein MIND_01295300 [Mycena indigotica]|uniref:Uncharacterized protein n=1 Tax=Mycena indigotica TaxID=2126181 RepID=A0A8H6VQQ8_9AGAR|nr:uncharacterized protein MIND_01295300 [Mycena indigotica]KAF7290552.1 hypothetical protein MIND_01295300 [Mycena indigotica]
MASQSPFEHVARNLRAIGALSVEEYLAKSGHEQDTSPVAVEVDNIIGDSAISRLRALCAPQGSAILTGSLAPRAKLEVELIDEGPDRKRCVVTITRPGGEARAFRSPVNCASAEEAEEVAAGVALERGVAEFIAVGDEEEVRAAKGTLLVSLDKQAPVIEVLTAVGHIEECCREWRGPSVEPAWYTFAGSNSYGACLKIALSPHNYRVYSCSPEFATPLTAQQKCAAIALDEGVLDFIMHGNGQTKPTPISRNSSDHVSVPWSLQAFFETIPRPLEEDFGARTAPQIQPVGWLGSIVAQAMGTRFSSAYYAVDVLDQPVRKAHGCLLRLKRSCPDTDVPTIYSYLVEPQANSQKEARAAVALLALSLGAGKMIRAAHEECLGLVSPDVRHFVTKSVLSVLGTEVRRASGKAPLFEFTTVDNAFGCTLTLFATLTAADPLVYTVPERYASKADAKVAVTHLAATRGVLDVLTQPAFPEGDGAGKKRKKKKQAMGSTHSGKKQRIIGGGVRLSLSTRKRSGSLEEGEISE